MARLTDERLKQIEWRTCGAASDDECVAMVTEIKAARDELIELRQKYVELLREAFESAARRVIGGTQWVGWWDATASSKARSWGDQLAEVAGWEKQAPQDGPFTFYRLQQPEQEQSDA